MQLDFSDFLAGTEQIITNNDEKIFLLNRKLNEYFTYIVANPISEHHSLPPEMLMLLISFKKCFISFNEWETLIVKYRYYSVKTIIGKKQHSMTDPRKRNAGL